VNVFELPEVASAFIVQLAARFPVS
jgi:hypothetical protein